MNNLTDLQTEVARRIWDCMAEHEDKCDLELEDVPLDHPLWEIVSILTEFVK